MYDVVVMRKSRAAPIASAMKTPERTPAQLPPLGNLFEDPAISEGKKTEMLRALREHAHIRTPKSQKQFVNAVRAAMAGDRLNADAATMTISSPTRSPRVADLRRQLEFAAAQRVQAAARGREARVATRAVRARSIARRFRPTSTRSGAATHVARIVPRSTPAQKCGNDAPRS